MNRTHDSLSALRLAGRPPNSGRSDGNSPNNSRSVSRRLAGTAQVSEWTAAFTSAHQRAASAFAAASRQQTMTPANSIPLALVRAHRGQVQEARELSGEALVLCDQTGNVPVMTLVLSVLGFLALSVDDFQIAHSHLARLAEAIAAFGLGEPSVVKFLPDEIEALAALGEVGLARSFTLQLEARGKSLGRPWAAGDGRTLPRPARRCGWRPPGSLGCL